MGLNKKSERDMAEDVKNNKDLYEALADKDDDSE